MDDDVSVRVAVRIRPQIPREVIDMCRICTDVAPGAPQIALGTDKAFTYDYVFDMQETQEAVYETCVASLIDGALAGYNATVLAYGQTGSGKTYTMGTGFDVELAPAQTGIIPRAIEHLFSGIEQSVQAARDGGALPPDFKVMAQFMELYNEEVIDLFNPIADNYLKGHGYKIHEDPTGGIHIKGVTMRPVASVDEALQCLRLGALSRTTASTQMNSQSSRSHAIFTLHVKQQRLVSIVDNDASMSISMSMASGRDENNGLNNEFETLTAKFHFVDLAGSERLKRTGATGDRAKEGISINCGLLALGNVISALGDVTKRALHVPYRDSKLTRLLQDSLGGNSQTVMIACISPSDRDFMETLNTLKYANRARNIKNKIVINQDKSSRTISILKQQIAELQLELIEYKQGKRIVGDDGTEQVNDMFYENGMLQGELSNLRTRVKAMQDTINSLSAKNTALLAEKATDKWASAGCDPNLDVKDMVQAYLEEIEGLRAKLMESNYTCEQLRKSAAAVQDNLSRSLIMSGSVTAALSPLGDGPSLIEEAKRELRREKELLYKRSKSEETEELNEDSSDKDSESDSESDSDKVDEVLQAELFNLTTDIDMKQKLITELELSQQRLHTMRQHYEEKLMQLQIRIKDTQEERDKVLQSFSGMQTQPTEKVKKIKDEYERKLQDMLKELKRLQSARKEHARLLKNQTQHELQLKSLKNELGDMKRAKVKLINKMKEESQKHKEAEMKRVREIAQLRKESRRNANVIRSMEAEKRVKEQVLRRKQEEVLALRRENRKGLSRKVAGRFGPDHKFSPKVAKQKWINVENVINKIAMTKQGLVEQELRMERLLEKRESLGKELEKYINKRNILMANNQDVAEISSFIDDIKANINYIQETISETQHNVMEIEESQESNDTLDIVQSVFDIDEARYLIHKLFNMTVNQSYAVAQRDVKLKESEASLNEVKQESYVRSQLLDHMLHTDQDLYGKSNMITSFSSNVSDSEPSSNNSSRSSSPIDNSVNAKRNGQRHQVNKNKIRRKTVQPSELLFGSNADEDGHTGAMTQSQEGVGQRQMQPIVRVPSAPGSLKGLVPLRPSVDIHSPAQKPKSLLSPRPTHRVPLSVQATKHGSMEQGLDWSVAGSSGSPVSYRRVTSREDNVFSRLTSSTAQVDAHSASGNIVPYAGKVRGASLQCVAVAEGHNNGVLALCATDRLLFTGAADRTVKVWDLQTRAEVTALHGHPNNVVAVRYDARSSLLLSASSYFLKVWDLRLPASQCIRVLCSSGMTQTHGSSSVAASNRTAQMPVGESQINDVLFNSTGDLICTAVSDKVRVWDVRRFACIGKLSGGHQAAVMCLAAENCDGASDIVVTGSKDHYIKVYNMSRAGAGNFGPTMNLEPPHYDGIQSLVVSDSVLFSGSRDMCIKKWDLKEKELVQSLNNAHKGWICGLALVKDDSLLLSGCRTGNMKLWDARTCDQLADIRAHNSAINAIATNSQNIFTASNCGEVKIWKLTDC